MTSIDQTLYERAKQCIPGGVNSPVRAFTGVGGNPLFFRQGQGAYLIGENGNKYIDFVGSWGPLILGHNHPVVVEAINQALQDGVSFGAPTRREIELAELICSIMPSIEQVRMVNSGTEATMTAIRLARGVTNRDKIIKFKGCYHGHNDCLLVKAGSGLLTQGTPDSKGVPASIVQHTLTADFNNIDSVIELFEHNPDQIAAIIIEPVPGNMNLVPPDIEFLQGLSKLCKKHDSLLIFDEVMSGFRVGLQGAEGLFGITPDICCLGKIVGGGLPVGAVGASKEIMSHLAPLGGVYQAGTLSGNPLAMAAGFACLQYLKENHQTIYPMLEASSKQLTHGLKQLASKHNIPMATQHLGGMFGFVFSKKDPIENFEDVCNADKNLFMRFYHHALKQGIYFAPSAFEAGFVSMCHDEEIINMTLTKVEQVFDSLSQAIPQNEIA